MSIYGLLIGIAFAVGAEFFSRNNNVIPKNKETPFIFLLFIFSILGARIYSVISDWNYYQQNPIQIMNTRAGGLGIFGGIVGAVIFIYIFSKVNHLKFLEITNIMVAVISLGQSLGRWGNYINKEVFGIPTYINIGQFIPQNLRPVQYLNYSYFHPVWFYESVLNFILFLILLKKKNNQTAIYLIGYGLIRFFMEFIRWDTFIINNIKIGQVLSIIFIIIGIILILFKNSQKNKNNFYTH